MQFLNAFRPPSRHKTPPKAVGLDLPPGPHTPPETQKEIEEVRELSRTQHLQGLAFLNEENKTVKCPTTQEVDENDSLLDSSGEAACIHGAVEEIQTFGSDNVPPKNVLTDYYSNEAGMEGVHRGLIQSPSPSAVTAELQESEKLNPLFRKKTPSQRIASILSHFNDLS